MYPQNHQTRTAETSSLPYIDEVFPPHYIQPRSNSSACWKCQKQKLSQSNGFSYSKEGPNCFKYVHGGRVNVMLFKKVDLRLCTSTSTSYQQMHKITILFFIWASLTEKRFEDEIGDKGLIMLCYSSNNIFFNFLSIIEK